MNDNTNDNSTSDRLGRRRFLAAAAAVVTAGRLASAQGRRNYGANAPPVRYPDPDVVVLDVTMPGKTGLEVAKEQEGLGWIVGDQGLAPGCQPRAQKR